ncbi:CAD16 protein, partial [Polypterus senegalus]
MRTVFLTTHRLTALKLSWHHQRMDHYVVFQNSKRVTLRYKDMTAEKQSCIFQVQWNGQPVIYKLKGDDIGSIFSISAEGIIYVNGPLDRETQAKFQMKVFAENSEGTAYADPLELRVIVRDENDNSPTFSQLTYQTTIKELTTKGTEILRVQATDIDEPSTDNSQISYQIVSQTPTSKGPLFKIDGGSGSITLEAPHLLSYKNQYTLKVLAQDMNGAEGGLSGHCTIIVDVTDVNNNPPVFSEKKLGPFELSEETEIGTVVTKITALDEDQPRTDNWFVDFRIVSGNENGIFKLQTDRTANEARVILNKKLDSEETQKYDLKISAQNVAALVGRTYGSDSSVSLVIQVVKVLKAPKLSKDYYEVKVKEDVPVGTVIFNFGQDDIDKQNPRYYLSGNAKNVFSIDEDTGKIRTNQLLDKEQDTDCTLEIMAQSRENSSLSATAILKIILVDVNDNPPTLMGDYSDQYLCTPQREGQAILLKASDRDEHNGNLQFSLVNDPNIVRNWRLERVNVLVCQCTNRGDCMTEVGPMPGKPSLQSTVAILVGTLGFIASSSSSQLWLVYWKEAAPFIMTQMTPRCSLDVISWCGGSLRKAPGSPPGDLGITSDSTSWGGGSAVIQASLTVRAPPGGDDILS